MTFLLPFGIYTRIGEIRVAMSTVATTRFVMPCSLFLPTFHCRLVYRDIKLDNIGFDVRGNKPKNVISSYDALLCSDEALLFLSFEGDVKVFDFGLCKDLDPKLEVKDGLYKLTGGTGCFPYMAPGKRLRLLLLNCVEMNPFSL